MDINEKLAQFSQVAIDIANEHKESILRNIEEQFNKSCEAERNILEDKAKITIRKEKHNAERERNKNIINATIESRKTLTNRRNELINELFNNVLIKLNTFTKSIEYQNWIIECVNNAKLELKDDSVKVILCEADKTIAATISKNTNSEVELSNIDFIGGCKIISSTKNMLIDNTFNSRIDKERQTFNKLKIKD